jgi:heat shock protein HtpX
MWEQIASNRRRSVVFLLVLFAVLVVLGFLIGSAVDRQGGLYGVAAALAVWGVLYLIAAFAGDQVVLSTAGARKIEKADAPQLFNIVEEMAIASGQRMPDVYLIPDESPNAFAAGRSEQKRVVAVTSGLLRLCTRDELQGVIAHEMGHHKNGDVRFMILAGVMLGAIVILAEMFLRSGLGRHRSSRSSSSSSSKDGGGQAALMIIAVVFALLAPLLARLLYMACSRRREYLADASAARFTRYPEGLASALEKISGHYTSRRETSRVLAPLYIVNPMEALAAMGLFSTHPPVEKRVEVLRSMGGRAGFQAYEEAFQKVTGRSAIGSRTLAADAPVEARPPDARPDPREEKVARAKQAADLVGRLAQMVAFSCACGVSIRLPAGLKRDTIACPRCGAENRVPTAEAPASAPAAGGAIPLRFQRQGTGWQSFRCACGRSVHLSPSFAGTHATCEGCRRQIEIV